EQLRALAGLPIEHLDAGRPLQVIDVADLADAAHRQRLAVRRERQAADAADRVDTLLAVPRVHARRLDAGDELARRRLPDADVADLVAGRQVLAVGRERDGVEHRREVVGRLLLVPLQLVQQLAGAGVPQLAHHVVGDAGERLAVGAGRDLAYPPGMRLDGAARLLLRHVPPDQLAVVAARDGNL